jgi:hypothetical protein
MLLPSMQACKAAWMQKQKKAIQKRADFTYRHLAVKFEVRFGHSNTATALAGANEQSYSAAVVTAIHSGSAAHQM